MESEYMCEREWSNPFAWRHTCVKPLDHGGPHLCSCGEEFPVKVTRGHVEWKTNEDTSKS